jgi:hypothetical protein
MALNLICIFFKNWFKNKRSRVMSDPNSKQNLPALNCGSISNSNNSTSVSINNKINQNENYVTEKKQHEENFMIQISSSSNISNQIQFIKFTEPHHLSTTTATSVSNKNLNSLLNIVNSIGDETTPTSNVQHGSKIEKIKNSRNNSDSNKLMGKQKNKASQKDTQSEQLGICKECLKISKVLCTCNVSKIALNRLYSNHGLDFQNAHYHSGSNPILNNLAFNQENNNCNFNNNVNKITAYPNDTFVKSFSTKPYLSQNNYQMFKNYFSGEEKIKKSGDKTYHFLK